MADSHCGMPLFAKMCCDLQGWQPIAAVITDVSLL